MANPVDWLRLRSEFWSAAVDPAGAQLSLLRDAQGNDLLWNGDPAFWTGRAPILFPIVGTLNEGHYRWRGKRHAFPRHGFARGRDFEVLRQDDEVVHLRLSSDDESLQVFPFHFELDLVYCIDGPLFAVAADDAGVAGLTAPDPPVPQMIRCASRLRIHRTHAVEVVRCGLRDRVHFHQALELR